MKAYLSASAVVVGALLLIASAVWGILFPADQAWTEEKSTRMTAVGDQATAIKMELAAAKTRPTMHAGRNPAELQAEYDKLDAEYRALYEEFKGANESPKTASRILRWSGIAFVVAGAIVVFANREA